MRRQDAALLALLSAIWGASFMFMRYLAPILGPLATADLRVLIAGIALSLWLAATGFRLRWPERLKAYLVVGLLNSGIPFALYSFAALTLPASTEAVINALSPSFGAAFSAIWLGEAITARKAAGLALGAGGVAVVAGFGSSGRGAAAAVLACVGAAACYGLAGVYVKKRASGIEPKAMAAGSQLLAGLVLAPSLALPPPVALARPGVAAVVLAFSLLCSAVAYLIYYRLLASVGPTKALTVTFLIPVFGFAWGALFLGERLVPAAAAGALLILSGTYLVAGGPRAARA